MPIKGLSEQRRFTRCGIIRLGKKAQGQRGQYPVKSDHFIADFQDPAMNDLFYRIYGEQPKKISIAFGAETQDEIFPQWYKCYGKSTGLKCKGDGEVAHRANDAGEFDELECPAPAQCDYAKQHGCKQLASLVFFVRGIPGMQIAQINTTSYNSIKNLNTGIALLQAIRGGRRISGVWVDLELVPQQAHANGKAVEIFVLKLNINASLDNLTSLECAFEQPRLLPGPDETTDPYLFPETEIPAEPEPAKPAAPLGDADARFAKACAACCLTPKDEAKSLQASHGAKSWKAVMDTQKIARAKELELQAFESACALNLLYPADQIVDLLNTYNASAFGDLPPDAIHLAIETLNKLEKD